MSTHVCHPSVHMHGPLKPAILLPPPPPLNPSGPGRPLLALGPGIGREVKHPPGVESEMRAWQGPGGPRGLVRGPCLLWAPWATHVGPWSPRQPCPAGGAGNLPGRGEVCWRGLDCTPHTHPVPERAACLMPPLPAAGSTSVRVSAGLRAVALLLRRAPDAEPVGSGAQPGGKGGLPYTRRLPPPTWQVPTDHLDWWPGTPGDPQPRKH